jgi:tetratricopeptide (TPR) repeat protein
MSLFAKWFKPNPEKFCDEGLAALDRRDFAAAAKAFRECVETTSRESTVRIARFHLAECHAYLAEAAFGEGDFMRAREEMEMALSYAQPTAERHLIAAQIARRLEDREGAEFHLAAALEKDPTFEQALALQALSRYEAGRIDEAIADADALPENDGRLRRFREAHERGDRTAATGHLIAVAAGYPDSLL